MKGSAYYEGRLCDSNLSYEYFTHPPLTLDLHRVGEEMEKIGMMLEIHTPFVLVFNWEGIRTSLYPSGKILFKNLHIEEKAKGLFERLMGKIHPILFG